MYRSSVETAQLRKNDVLATNLLFGGLVLSWVTMLLGVLLGVAPILLDNLVLGKILVNNLLQLGLVYAIKKGEKWAKIVLLLLFVGGSIVLALKFDAIVSSAPVLYRMDYLLRLIIYVVALVVLFKKPRLEAPE